MAEFVDLKRDGAIAHVVMHRNGLNAIAEELMQELAEAFHEVGGDASVRVVILESEYEKYFSVGADLGMLGSIDRSSPDAAEEVGAFMKRMNAHFSAIERCPRPVIAAINGHALGGGSELTLCCDYRVMVEDGRSRIGQTESSLGIIPGAGGTQRLPRLIGKAKAQRYLIESTRLSAHEAAAVGWVDIAVAPIDYQATVDALAAKLIAVLHVGFLLALAGDGQDVVLKRQLNLILLEARQLRANRQLVLVFVKVEGRNPARGRDGVESTEEWKIEKTTAKAGTSASMLV